METLTDHNLSEGIYTEQYTILKIRNTIDKSFVPDLFDETSHNLSLVANKNTANEV